MGITLNVEAETPSSDLDRDSLAGISVMTLAIANRQDLADQQHMQQQEEEEEEVWDPVTAAFGAADSLVTRGRSGQAATLLPDGRVLVVGGASAEVWEPGDS